MSVLRSVGRGLPCLAALLACFAGCGGRDGSKQDEIAIGVYGSLTGNEALWGQSTRNGVELAISELSGGTIGGLALRTVVEDDQGRAEEAATVVQKLVNQDRVVCVIGEVASSRSLAGAPICQAAGVPMISPASTNPRVTQTGDYIFRMCFLDDFQGEVVARFAFENLGLRRVAILKDVKSDYSVGLAGFFTSAFTSRGGAVVIDQAYSGGDQDFRAQLTAIKAQQPDGVVVPGYYTEAGLIARQARELGITQPLLGGDGWEAQQLLDIGGEALNGSYYSNHWALDAPEPRLQQFLTAYRDKFGLEPDSMAGLAYDAAKVLLQALEKFGAEDPALFAALGSSRAGTPDRRTATAKLRDLVAATRDFPGVTGSITLDRNRNASKPAVMIGVEGGKRVYKATIAPASS